MSIINEALAPCSKCGQQHKVIVYRSINISENPELKDKVKDGSLFLWECPHCGQVNLAKYETLYHDPAAKLMVWLISLLREPLYSQQLGQGLLRAPRS